MQYVHVDGVSWHRYVDQRHPARRDELRGQILHANAECQLTGKRHRSPVRQAPGSIV